MQESFEINNFNYALLELPQHYANCTGCIVKDIYVLTFQVCLEY